MCAAATLAQVPSCMRYALPDLVGDDHRAAVLVGEALQAAHEAAQVDLPRRQLPAPLVLHPASRSAMPFVHACLREPGW